MLESVKTTLFAKLEGLVSFTERKGKKTVDVVVVEDSVNS